MVKETKNSFLQLTPAKRVIDKYYGPANPQSETTIIKLAPNSRKGIFCKDCEEHFAVYENAAQSKLNEQVNILGKGEYQIHRTSNGIKFIETDIHENILITLFESIIWRQCIEQTLDGNVSPLPALELEQLRNSVLENIYIPIEEIKKTKLINNKGMTIFTTYCTNSNKTATYANPHPLDTNPLLFMIGPFDVFYWLNNKVTNEIEKHLNIDRNLLSDELSIKLKRIAVINASEWKRVHKKFAAIVARQYLT